MTIQELLEAHATKKQAGKDLVAAIDAKCLAEKRDTTDAEDAQIQASADAIEAAHKALKKAQNRESLRQTANEDLSAPLPRKTGHEVAASTTEPMVAVEGWRKDPKRGFTGLKQMLGQALVASKEFGGDIRAAVKARRVNESLLYLNAREDKSSPPSLAFAAPSGMEIVQTAGSDEHGEYADSSLGFLIPDPLLPQVLTVAPPTVIGANTLQIPMPAPSVRIPARTDKDHTTSVSGGLRVYRRGETQDANASKIAIHRILLIANTLMGVTFETEELLQDAPAAAIALINQGFNDEFMSRRVRELLRGSGAGEFLGILKSPALITVAAEAGQPADSFTFNNATALMAQCWGYDNAAWIINHGLIPQLAKMNAGVNGLVWASDARSGIPNTLLGRPVMFTEYASAPGDLGDVMLVNWTQYLEGNLQGLQSGESVHVRFLEHERTFKFTKRDAGAPWWNSDLTPIYGPHLSPYLTLAAR